MSNIHEWDPSAATLSNSHRQVLDKAWREREADQLSITESDQTTLRSVLPLGPQGWEKFAENYDQTTIVQWIKVLVLCEEQLPGFECGAKSPVIGLARVLRNRGAFPDDLTAWIKEHSTNRFLPYGSLLDRL